MKLTKSGFNAVGAAFERVFSSLPENSKVYRLLYEEVDETSVNLVSLLTMPGREPEKYRFPTPGTPNATSTLRFVQFDLNEEHRICNVVKLDFKFSLSQVFPWAEYLVRAGWMPCGSL